jgi:hypothetical protein
MRPGLYRHTPRSRPRILVRLRAAMLRLSADGARPTAVRRRISRPGLYMIEPRDYHADPVVRPSLSHSIARILLDRSPLHARHAHPRLTPGRAPVPPTPAMIAGAVLHKLLLGRGEEVVVVPSEDYRRAEARAARDEALARGALPVLVPEFQGLRACADAVVQQLREEPEAASFFAPGWSEAVAVWRLGPVWCRAMIDRLPRAPGLPMWDIKSTGLSARPQDWERALARRYATQAAFYRLGVGQALRRPPGELRFVVFERDPPYAVSIVACGETMLEAAEAEVKRALKLWATCTITGTWPGYGPGVHHIEAPVHMLMRAESAMAKAA